MASLSLMLNSLIHFKYYIYHIFDSLLIKILRLFLTQKKAFQRLKIYQYTTIKYSLFRAFKINFCGYFILFLKIVFFYYFQIFYYSL